MEKDFSISGSALVVSDGGVVEFEHPKSDCWYNLPRLLQSPDPVIQIFDTSGVNKYASVLYTSPLVDSTLDGQPVTADSWREFASENLGGNQELQKDHFSTPLTDSGDGSNANQDYSGAPETFSLTPDLTEIFEVGSVIISIEDNGPFDSGFYGNNITLTNGILVRKYDGTQETIFSPPGNVKTNANWVSIGNFPERLNWGTGTDSFMVTISFETNWGSPLRLDGSKNERLEFILNDDFDQLVSHYFIAQGLKYSK